MIAEDTGVATFPVYSLKIFIFRVDNADREAGFIDLNKRHGAKYYKILMFS